jgi:hypothetical protein
MLGAGMMLQLWLQVICMDLTMQGMVNQGKFLCTNSVPK